MKENKNVVCKIVRHYKGNYYYIVNVGKDSDDLSQVVIYKALYNDDIWVRSYNEFFEEIDKDIKGNITHQEHRFEIVEDLHADYRK